MKTIYRIYAISIAAVIYGGLFCMIFFGCVSVPIPSEVLAPAPPSPAVPGQWPAQYSAFLSAALDSKGAGLVASRPKDLGAWCANYTPAKSKAFYTALFSALAKYESDWNPATTYLENFPDSHGNRVESLGLFQMSISDCGITDRAKFFDPATNIGCAVTKFAALVAQNGVILDSIKVYNTDGSLLSTTWLGAARYWSQFRKPDRVAAMQVKTQEACK